MFRFSFYSSLLDITSFCVQAIILAHLLRHFQQPIGAIVVALRNQRIPIRNKLSTRTILVDFEGITILDNVTGSYFLLV
jgi:hypothetical protein